MTTTSMIRAEREAFLSQPMIAVISIPKAGRGPLSVPVWYYYEPGGDLCVWTGSQSHKARLLQDVKRISICVQDPMPPYKYVSVEGTFNIEPVKFERDIRPMALRYYGPEAGEAYLASLGGDAGSLKTSWCACIPNAG
jgi:nitroimidazol reductase NimA-like FMN-containing flavoprotein (pyridoxamine 5'-phosphate oxidase superfamily)